MSASRFEQLAAELADRDQDLAAQLEQVRAAGERLRSVAEAAVAAFQRVALERGAEHLATLQVTPVEPDEKHVDCLQLRVERGRWAALCVLKAQGSATLVGPFKRGKEEKPCLSQPIAGPEVERALEDLIERLIRVAAER